MELNNTLLREISYQITDGNPWWGLALCNEYLPSYDATPSPNTRLRRTLVMCFRRRIGVEQSCNPIATALINGKRKDELTKEARKEVGKRVLQKNKPLARPKAKRPNTHRLASRERRTIQRYSRSLCRAINFSYSDVTRIKKV